jgi:hypothetical protein
MQQVVWIIAVRLFLWVAGSGKLMRKFLVVLLHNLSMGVVVRGSIFQ